jgi:hypothetical protein
LAPDANVLVHVAVLGVLVVAPESHYPKVAVVKELQTVKSALQVPSVPSGVPVTWVWS